MAKCFIEEIPIQITSAKGSQILRLKIKLATFIYKTAVRDNCSIFQIQKYFQLIETVALLQKCNIEQLKRKIQLYLFKEAANLVKR